MIIKLFTSLKIAAAILAVMDLSRFSTAHADDPAYYKLEDVKELTIYKRAKPNCARRSPSRRSLLG